MKYLSRQDCVTRTTGCLEEREVDLGCRYVFCKSEEMLRRLTLTLSLRAYFCSRPVELQHDFGV